MTRGPVPNRESDLARPRSRKGSDQRDATKGVARRCEPYAADPDWHPIARRLYDSLILSGQSDFYQQSDWAFAYSLMDDLSFYKKPFVTKDGEEYHKRSGQMLQTIYSALSNLMVTEADRRRLRIELEEEQEAETPAGVVAMADARERLRAKPTA